MNTSPLYKLYRIAKRTQILRISLFIIGFFLGLSAILTYYPMGLFGNLDFIIIAFLQLFYTAFLAALLA